jgi:hypothetical protein
MFSCLVADNYDIMRDAASTMMTAASLLRLDLEQSGACLSVWHCSHIFAMLWLLSVMKSHCSNWIR